MLLQRLFSPQCLYSPKNKFKLYFKGFLRFEGIVQRLFKGGIGLFEGLLRAF